MARLARMVVPGVPVHVTQRGNHREQIFDDDQSRGLYLSLIWRYSQKHSLAIWAYCLMTNHVHFVVVPRQENSMARCFRGAHMRFTQWVNQRRRQSGHLWQNRYFACLLDETHLWAAVRYVERNPVRAGMSQQAFDYPWSSAAGHCGRKVDGLLAKDFPPAGVIADWAEWLKDEDAAQSMAVRRQTNSGRPCGSIAFMERVEALLGRVVRPQKRGRRTDVQMNAGKGAGPSAEARAQAQGASACSRAVLIPLRPRFAQAVAGTTAERCCIAGMLRSKQQFLGAEWPQIWRCNSPGRIAGLSFLPYGMVRFW